MTISYRVLKGPSFGSKRLAREALAANRTDVLDPKPTVRWLESSLGSLAALVVECAFRQSTFDGFLYTTIDIWTKGDVRVRDAIFASRADFVRMTGWYPRSHGEPLNRQKLPAYRTPAQLATRRPIGPTLRTVERVVTPDRGVAIRIRTEQGSILLDTGFEGYLPIEDADAVVLLSHSHADHSGGLRASLEAGLPAAMSPTTYELLPGRALMPRRREGVELIRPDSPWVPIGDGIRFRSFPVPHMPGSLGFLVTDGLRCVLYTGDICLRTARHDFTDDLINLATETPAACTLLLDGEMIDRPFGASGDDAANALYEAASDAEDVGVIADYPEQALYCYLDLFHTRMHNPALRDRWAFIATPSIRRMMELVLSSKGGANLDPFLVKQYGVRSAVQDLWGESTFLYWSDTLTRAPSTMGRIWITCMSDAKLIKPKGTMRVVRIGRASRSSVAIIDEADLLDVPTSPWTVHSDSSALVDAVERISKVASVGFFHKSASSVNRWSRQQKIESWGLGEHPVALGDGRDPSRLATAN